MVGLNSGGIVEDWLSTLIIEWRGHVNNGREEARAVVAKAIAPHVKGHLDTLKQMVEDGPVHDGHIISKTSRQFWFETGLAARVFVGGCDGHSAALTFAGWFVEDMENYL